MTDALETTDKADQYQTKRDRFLVNMFEILIIPAADPVELPLAGGPGPLFAILASYLLFLVVGPKLMANREPFKLRGVLKVYNIMQILFNSVILIGVSSGIK